MADRQLGRKPATATVERARGSRGRHSALHGRAKSRGCLPCGGLGRPGGNCMRMPTAGLAPLGNCSRRAPSAGGAGRNATGKWATGWASRPASFRGAAAGRWTRDKDAFAIDCECHKRGRDWWGSAPRPAYLAHSSRSPPGRTSRLGPQGAGGYASYARRQAEPSAFRRQAISAGAGEAEWGASPHCRISEKAFRSAHWTQPAA